jgi:hypothetical protein
MRRIVHTLRKPTTPQVFETVSQFENRAKTMIFGRDFTPRI